MNNPLTAPLWVPTRRHRAFRSAKRLMDRVVLRVIESRRRGGPEENALLVVDWFLQAWRQSSDSRARPTRNR